MGFIVRKIIEWLLRFGATPARWIARGFISYFGSELIRGLAAAANRADGDQREFRETLEEANKYPSTVRQLFFSLLKDVVIEEVGNAVWSAFVDYARQVRQTQPDLREAARDAIEA